MSRFLVRIAEVRPGTEQQQTARRARKSFDDAFIFDEVASKGESEVPTSRIANDDDVFGCEADSVDEVLITSESVDQRSGERVVLAEGLSSRSTILQGECASQVERLLEETFGYDAGGR
jgi:hypothetical protein